MNGMYGAATGQSISIFGHALFRERRYHYKVREIHGQSLTALRWLHYLETFKYKNSQMRSGWYIEKKKKKKKKKKVKIKFPQVILFYYLFPPMLCHIFSCVAAWRICSFYPRTTDKT